MCNIDISLSGVSSQGTFDSSTGSYTFVSNDAERFPQGSYGFTLTASLETATEGTKTSNRSFTLRITGVPAPECDFLTPMIFENPFASKTYFVLGNENPIVMPFDVTTIGNIEDSNTAECGGPGIEIILNTGSTAFDPIFSVDYTNSQMTVSTTSDINKVGQYFFRFKYFNHANPANFAQSAVFQIEIVDPCNPPDAYPTKPVLTAPALTNQQYVITDAPQQYVLPQWSVTPAHCADKIIYGYTTILPNAGAQAVDFDIDTFTFNYASSDDLSGQTSQGTNYVVNVFAMLYTRTSTASFTLNIMNPCFVSEFFSVSAPESLADETYVLGGAA